MLYSFQAKLYPKKNITNSTKELKTSETVKEQLMN